MTAPYGGTQAPGRAKDFQNSCPGSLKSQFIVKFRSSSAKNARRYERVCGSPLLPIANYRRLLGRRLGPLRSAVFSPRDLRPTSSTGKGLVGETWIPVGLPSASLMNVT